jgi:putative ABC transport system ATP-binding protein
MASLVEVTDVVKRFGAADPTLDHVSFEVQGGEFLCVTGPSGSGKSTLLNVIAGLDRADSGSVRVDGVDISEMNESQRARFRLSRIGLVFQFFNLLESLSVIENVMAPARLAGIDRRTARKLAAETLASVGLSGKDRQYPNSLSGGERQRVAVARAVINRPALLLADEPTGALDSENGKRVMDLLRERNQAGQTVVMVTHDIQLAGPLATRTLHLRDGRLSSVESSDGLVTGRSLTTTGSEAQ